MMYLACFLLGGLIVGVISLMTFGTPRMRAVSAASKVLRSLEKNPSEWTKDDFGIWTHKSAEIQIRGAYIDILNPKVCHQMCESEQAWFRGIIKNVEAKNFADALDAKLTPQKPVQRFKLFGGTEPTEGELSRRERRKIANLGQF